ncbi:sarcosine oxidase delta subunit [Allocatelliglobosispora scoriae]|uniref:Sarcosine oxidase delta subunit n=1 Tax=Allocatelliglobosispora scoriae TaxID=643052 RepID=A0A841C5Q0_9ACTN|nr:hypothetical protein [Allocatelliglobosispora scoriae]MBB5874270.1 sarcosine oxidase delta subunit [Allocatelliglobosispora scoriae]
MSQDINSQTLLQAARSAIGDLGDARLVLEEHGDLGGISIGDAIRQAYLFPGRSGVVVEVWRHNGRDAYLVCSRETVAGAVDTALHEIVRRTRRNLPDRRFR